MDNVVVSIDADDSGFEEGMDKVDEKTKTIGAQLKEIGVSAGVAFAALSAAVYKSIEAFDEEERITNQLNATLQATGGIAGVTAENVRAMADSIAATTIFTDESAIAAQRMLLTFTNIGKNVFPAVTKAAADLAAGLGMELPAAASLLGKVLQDPITGMRQLRGANIVLSAAQKEQLQLMQLQGNTAGAQTLILNAVTAAYGGQAEALAKGTGAFTQLRKEAGELTEALGGIFAPALIGVATQMKAFIVTVKESKVLLTLGAAAITVAAALTGSVAALASATYAWGQLSKAMVLSQAVMTATGITMKTVLITSGIGIVLVALGTLYAYWDKVWPAMQAVFIASVKTMVDAAGGFAKVLKGAFTMDIEMVRKGEREAAAAFVEGAKSVKSAFTGGELIDKAAAARAGTEASMAENAARIRQDQIETARRNAMLLAAQKAGHQAEIMAMQGHSAVLVDLKKKEADLLTKLTDDSYNKEQKAIITRALADTRKDIDAANKVELKAKQNFDKQYQKTDQQNLAARRAVLKQNLDDQQQFHATFLQNEVKFGTTYAQLQDFMHNTIITGTRSAFDEMQQMTASHNSALKAAGQMAAVANIGIKTAESAMSIYAGWASIPFVGQALGITFAALAVLFGAERISEVLAAKQGGIVTGGISGMDSVPALLTPGELVVPTQNFEEVVRAVNTQRRAGGGPGAGSGGAVRVIVQFKGDAARLLQVQAIQDQALGTYRG